MYMYVYECICMYFNVFCMYMILYFYQQFGLAKYMQVYVCIYTYMALLYASELFLLASYAMSEVLNMTGTTQGHQS